MNDEYVSPQAITKIYGVTSTTLRNWAESGKIKFIRPNNGRRLYNKDDVCMFFEQTKSKSQDQTQRHRVLYARVSAPHQAEDLTRQIECLQAHYPNDQLLQDIDSGLNFKRKGFETLLELIFQGNVSEVVVAYKDRLCRFGFELFEWLCQKYHTQIVVLNPVSETVDRTQELAEDLFSIVTVFVAKNNGLRASQNRQKRNQSQKDQAASQSSTENQT